MGCCVHELKYREAGFPPSIQWNAIDLEIEKNPRRSQKQREKSNSFQPQNSIATVSQNRTGPFTKPPLQMSSNQIFKIQKSYNSKYRLSSNELPSQLKASETKPEPAEGLKLYNNSAIMVEVEQETEGKNKQNQSIDTMTSSKEGRQPKPLTAFRHPMTVERISRSNKSEVVRPHQLKQFMEDEIDLRQTFVPTKLEQDWTNIKPKRYEGGLSVISEVSLKHQIRSQKSSAIMQEKQEKSKGNPNTEATLTVPNYKKDTRFSQGTKESSTVSSKSLPFGPRVSSKGISAVQLEESQIKNDH